MSKQATTTAPTRDTPVKAARIRKGLTLAQVIEACDKEGVTLSEGYLSRVERGKYTGSPRVRAALAKVLDLDAYADFEQVKAG